MQPRINALPAEVQYLGSLSVIDFILEIVCQTTGMGFAAVARVTANQWIACSVRDEINFGLKPGGELKVETTICSEVRQVGKEIAIDNVAESTDFCNHPTPAMYNFKSYISIPVYLRNGDFFGTLCAIDPAPASVNNEKTIGIFRLFAELISFHLEGLQIAEDSRATMNDLQRSLRNSREEVLQYQFISTHTLQEPLRKLRLFVSLLKDENTQRNKERFSGAIDKISETAERFATLIHGVDRFNSLNSDAEAFEMVDLNLILSDLIQKLQVLIKEKEAIITIDVLPVIMAMPLQMKHLFYQLFSNALKYTQSHRRPMINVLVSIVKGTALSEFPFVEKEKEYAQITIADNGMGINQNQREKIFNLFAKIEEGKNNESIGIGLAQCRRIVNNHKGFISLSTEAGQGATFLVVLPLTQ